MVNEVQWRVKAVKADSKGAKRVRGEGQRPIKYIKIVDEAGATIWVRK